MDTLNNNNELKRDIGCETQNTLKEYLVHEVQKQPDLHRDFDKVTGYALTLSNETKDRR
jgi:hypothetical protein